MAMALADRQRWVAYELLYHHPGGLDHLGVEEVERLGKGMADWGSVDAFGCLVSGVAWRRGASRTRPSTAGQPLPTGGGGGPRWSRRCRSTSGPGEAPATPGAPSTSAGGWPPTVAPLGWVQRSIPPGVGSAVASGPTQRTRPSALARCAQTTSTGAAMVTR
jgi:hypothetical protein